VSPKEGDDYPSFSSTTEVEVAMKKTPARKAKPDQPLVTTITDAVSSAAATVRKAVKRGAKAVERQLPSFGSSKAKTQRATNATKKPVKAKKAGVKQSKPKSTAAKDSKAMESWSRNSMPR
jgi:hypothetical protein